MAPLDPAVDIGWDGTRSLPSRRRLEKSVLGRILCFPPGDAAGRRGRGGPVSEVRPRSMSWGTCSALGEPSPSVHRKSF